MRHSFLKIGVTSFMIMALGIFSTPVNILYGEAKDGEVTVAVLHGTTAAGPGITVHILNEVPCICKEKKCEPDIVKTGTTDGGGRVIFTGLKGKTNFIAAIAIDVMCGPTECKKDGDCDLKSAVKRTNFTTDKHGGKAQPVIINTHQN